MRIRKFFIHLKRIAIAAFVICLLFVLRILLYGGDWNKGRFTKRTINTLEGNYTGEIISGNKQKEPLNLEIELDGKLIIGKVVFPVSKAGFSSEGIISKDSKRISIHSLGTGKLKRGITNNVKKIVSTDKNNRWSLKKSK